MVLTRYGSVAGLLLLVGTLVGAALFLVFFLLVPPDRGEEGVIAFMPFMGGFFGAVTALVASFGFLVLMHVWTKGRDRSIGSRALIGGAGAAGGAALIWVCFGFAWNSAYAWIVWGSIAAFCALLAAIVAVTATARAARRADAVTAATV